MTRNAWIATIAGVLLLGGGGYGACAADTGEEVTSTAQKGFAAESMEVDASVPETRDVEAPVPEPPNPAAEAGPGPECGEVVCEEGEACCYATGRCYPAECTDCCAALLNPPEPAPDAVRTEIGPNDAPVPVPPMPEWGPPGGDDAPHPPDEQPL